MPKVNICSLPYLSEVITQWKPTDVVSSVPIEAPGNVEWHPSYIDDIYDAQLLSYKQAIRSVLGIEGARILIHCKQGMSRSSALAIVKLFQFDRSGQTVLGFLEDHPEAEPNPLILLFGDEILVTHGAIVKACSSRYKGRNL